MLKPQGLKPCVVPDAEHREPKARHRVSWPIACLFMFLGLSSCVPMAVKPECHDQINECLKSCPPAMQPPEAANGHAPIDTRSQCEQACHQRCH